MVAIDQQLFSDDLPSALPNHIVDPPCAFKGDLQLADEHAFDDSRLGVDEALSAEGFE